MSDREVLKLYVDMVPFLGQVLGPGCEVIIHDVTDMEHSLVAMCNGISGREIGNPITDLARELVNRGDYQEKDYVANYTGHTKNMEFLSSTYYIKNEGRLIGLLCINKDLSASQEICTAVHMLLERFNLKAPVVSEYNENFDDPVETMIRDRIADVISQIGIVPSRMSPQEKTAAVQRLKEDGVLTLKGAVAEAASQLNVSIPTVYRYMNKKD